MRKPRSRCQDCGRRWFSTDIDAPCICDNCVSERSRIASNEAEQIVKDNAQVGARWVAKRDER